ncbi:MAG: hypothetical protein GQE15_18925 [Archangiaceae bacterium]|nr:hypothetical protein [Archangiaceae bacterium]
MVGFAAGTKRHARSGAGRLMRGLMVVCALVASVSFAEDDAQRRAREELEKQLNQMVEKAPSRVRVEFQPVDDPNFQVEELEISLDGKALKMPTAAAISGWVQDGAMPITTLDVTPGRHKVVAKVTIHNTASPMVSDEGDFRWRIAGDVGFDVASGIEVKVIVTPVRDAKQTDLGKRIKLTFPSQPVMIAKLDDGSMPEPTKVKPAPVVMAPVDAGPTKEQLAEAKKAADDAAKVAAADAKRAAAEEKQRKLEEAKLASAQAAEEKKRKLEEAKLAKAQAAEEKKRKLEEAKLAKAQAAEEKKRKLEEAKLAKAQAAEDAKRAQAEKQRLAEEAKLAAAAPKEAPAVADAGAAVVAEVPVVVDAGVAVVAEAKPAEPVDAGAAIATAPKPESAPESEGPPWMIIGGVIAVAALGLIVVLVRRAGRVPELKD